MTNNNKSTVIATEEVKTPRAIKTILERKSSKEVLALLEEGKTVSEICTELKIWGNRARFIKAELIKAELFIDAKALTIYDLLSKMDSKYSSVIVKNFRASKKVYNKQLLDDADVTRLTPDMKEDIQTLIDAGFVTKEKEGVKVFYSVK